MKDDIMPSNLITCLIDLGLGIHLSMFDEVYYILDSAASFAVETQGMSGQSPLWYNQLANYKGDILCMVNQRAGKILMRHIINWTL